MERRLIFGTTALFGVLALGEAIAQQSSEVPEPRITFHTCAEGVRGVKLRAYFRAPPDRVWGVVTTPAKAASLFKNVSAIKRSAKGPRYWDYHLSSILGDKVVTCEITRDDRRRRIQWKRVEGHLEELFGYYELSLDERYPEHTRVDYGSYIDPGGVGRVLMTNGSRRTAVRFMISQLRRMAE